MALLGGDARGFDARHFTLTEAQCRALVGLTARWRGTNVELDQAAGGTLLVRRDSDGRVWALDHAGAATVIATSAPSGTLKAAMDLHVLHAAARAPAP